MVDCNTSNPNEVLCKRLMYDRAKLAYLEDLNNHSGFPADFTRMVMSRLTPLQQ